MNQHQFNALLEKYLAGTCSEAEERLIQEWSETFVQQSQMPGLSAEKNQIEQRLWSRIRRSTFARPTVVRQLWSRMNVAAAAAIVLALGIGWFLYRAEINRPGSTKVVATLPKGVIQIRNTSTKPRQVTLEDGSLVTLKASSSISYPEHFGNTTRSVLLEGEAFFNVKKDPTKPFIVHTGELVTEVLGTSFSIRSYSHTPSIEVRVATGRVSVYENETEKPTQNRNGVILTPNQRVVFDKASHQLVPGLVENPVVIHPPATPQSFLFEDAPLPAVLKSLERAFGVEIVLENGALASCVLTADLTDLPLQTQLDLICKSLNDTCQQRGTVLFINGEGCR